MLVRLDRTILELEDMVGKVQDSPGSGGRPEFPVAFDVRFSRCHGLLSMTARRILGSDQGVEESVQKCWLAASFNPPRFESEPAFRSWLLRLLIDEALIILNVSEEERHKVASVRPRGIPQRAGAGNRT